MARIGLLITAAPAPYQEGFLQGLRELGYADRQNVVVERRSAYGEYDRLPALVAERWLGGLLGGLYDGAGAELVSVRIPATLTLENGVVSAMLYTWEIPWLDGFQHQAVTALRALGRERYRLRFCRNPRCQLVLGQPGTPVAFITKRRQVYCSEACSAAQRAREYRGRRVQRTARRRPGARRRPRPAR